MRESGGEGGEGGVALPGNMTEEDVIAVVRELLGEEDIMSDMELMDAYRSGLFQEFSPDIANYAKEKQTPATVEATSPPGAESSSAGAGQAHTGQPEKKVVPVAATMVVDIADSDTDTSEWSHHKKMKKKAKHHQEDDNRAKEKDKSEKGGGPTAGVQSSPKLKEVKQEVVQKKTPEKEKKKAEAKPFSKYDSSASHIKIRRWKPVLDVDHPRFQKKFSLKPISITCLDLLDLPILFHAPHKKAKNSNSVPLTTHLKLKLLDSTLGMINRMERDKLTWFKRALATQTLQKKKKKLADGHSRKRTVIAIPDSSSDDDDDKNKKGSADKAKKCKTITVPSAKKPKLLMEPQLKIQRKYRDRDAVKQAKSEKEAAAKKMKVEEIQRKAEQLAKAEQLKTLRKKAEAEEAANKEKAKALAENRRKLELQKEALEQYKKQPSASASVQRLLSQLNSSTKEQAKAPLVAFRVPKIAHRRPPPPSEEEYKVASGIGIDGVAKEVDKLLKSNVKVEVPVVPGVEGGGDLGEYTVRKLAWWLLKNERDPPDEGLYHPELHDIEEEAPVSSELDWPDDISFVGCASDPEGADSHLPPNPNKVNDPDWWDDYCGEASIYALIRMPQDKPAGNLDSAEPFKNFLRLKSGTNYAKSNFEVKCQICNERIKGQRPFGAHIRSQSHKTNFRIFSLNMASYEEKIEKPIPQKEFVAQLVEYSVNAKDPIPAILPPGLLGAGNNRPVAMVAGRARSLSPGPIIAGDTAANIPVHEMPIPDDNISFASAENYDISSDESLMNVKAVMMVRGKWNRDLEGRWRQWKDEEAKVCDVYNVKRELYINEPERHPAYQKEWLKFWEKRCNELEAEGRDTDNYNFNREWLPFWLKRMQEIMKEEIEERVRDLKERHKIDKRTLRTKYNISAEETNRHRKMEAVRPRDHHGNNNSRSRSRYEPTPAEAPFFRPSAPASPPPNRQPSYSSSSRGNNHGRHRHHPYRGNKRRGNNNSSGYRGRSRGSYRGSSFNNKRPNFKSKFGPSKSKFGYGGYDNSLDRPPTGGNASAAGPSGYQAPSRDSGNYQEYGNGNGPGRNATPVPFTEDDSRNLLADRGYFGNY